MRNFTGVPGDGLGGVLPTYIISLIISRPKMEYKIVKSFPVFSKYLMPRNMDDSNLQYEKRSREDVSFREFSANIFAFFHVLSVYAEYKSMLAEYASHKDVPEIIRRNFFYERMLKWIRQNNENTEDQILSAVQGNAEYQRALDELDNLRAIYEEQMIPKSEQDSFRKELYPGHVATVTKSVLPYGFHA